MTTRTAAIGIVLGLVALYAVTALGTFADCFVALWSGSLTGFIPNAALRAECWDRTILFPFSFFR